MVEFQDMTRPLVQLRDHGIQYISALPPVGPKDTGRVRGCVCPCLRSFPANSFRVPSGVIRTQFTGVPNATTTLPSRPTADNRRWTR